MIQHTIASRLGRCTHFPTASHRPVSLGYLLCLITMLFVTPQLRADTSNYTSDNRLNQAESHSSAKNVVQVQCLSSGDGYLKARLTGAIQAELDWRNRNMSCAGSVRPSGGLRLRFAQASNTKHPLVLLFGISGIHAGENGKVLAVNVTIMREGKGEFYSTQGDKCVVDDLKQSVLPGAPTQKRSYRVEAHGFCNQPARALNGDGLVLITRFDVAGRVDLVPDDTTSAAAAMVDK